ncbi:hypothetical protein [Yaniella halotolerans]|uniref:hypothetical protein n=1 Tax=Yaniella halotolerans TaxID=225453 RepID=UPI00146ED0D3|nr:hypothetical protein [Yaniella halotolerans]
MADKTPGSVKRFTLAFLIVALVMVGGQILNLVITFLPAAADTLIQVDGEPDVTVAALRNAYISSVLLIGLIYGIVVWGVYKSKNWARWVAVLLAVFAAAGGVNGLGRILATGSFDVVTLALSLAQLVASFWALSLAFRQDVTGWFKHRAVPQN